MTRTGKIKNRKPVEFEEEERDDAVIATALRWSLLALLMIAGTVAGAVYFWLRPQPEPPLRETELVEAQAARCAAGPTAPGAVPGHHRAGRDPFPARERSSGPEAVAGNHGWRLRIFGLRQRRRQDLLLVNSQQWPWDSPEQQPTMALYANDGTGQFQDVTAAAGLDIALYGMGAAVGDYDNDGYVDLFLSALGENRLLHNEQGKRFRDVTAQAGVAGTADQWSSGCGWFDYDNDGDLDLLVCNYVQWSREYDVAQDFRLTGGGRAYGRPQNFAGTFPYLYRNEGDGRFVEQAEQAGLCVKNPATQVPMAKSLGIAFADCDEDGWIDILVANDTVQNFLFHNRQDGTFEEIGSLTGVAFDSEGNARGAMGIDVARIRDSRALGVAIGNFANEMTALYVSYDSDMRFMDEAIASGLGPNTRLELTFGIFYFDYDLDGRLDLLAANGHLEEDINRVQPSQHYEQSPQLFWNCGQEHDTEFLPIGEDLCGADLLQPMVGRGASYADIDDDGDLDVLVTATGGAPRLLRNDQSLGHHYLRMRLVGTRCNRDALGASVTVRSGQGTQRRQVMPTRSYLSQTELAVTFGLGDQSSVDGVSIRWPDGTLQELGSVPVDQLHVVQQPTKG